MKIKVSQLREHVRFLLGEALVPKKEILDSLLEYVDWSENDGFRQEIENFIGRPIVDSGDLLAAFDFVQKRIDGLSTLVAIYKNPQADHHEYMYNEHPDMYADGTQWSPYVPEEHP